MNDEHDTRCRDGWVDLVDGIHPVACRTCRPELVRCRGCPCTWTVCETNSWITGRKCCPSCTHVRTYLDRRRQP